MKTKAEQKGECPCTHDGCPHVLKVYKYQERSARPSRFKGKFYADRCPDHGCVIDPSPVSQEHILQRGTIWGAAAPKTAAEPPPPQVPKPKATATPTAPAPTPAAARAPTPAQPAKGPALSGWNLWDWWGDQQST